jgi:hypothetical protein
VKRRRVAARRDDAFVAELLPAAGAELGLDQVAELALGPAGADLPHRREVAAAGGGDRAPHLVELARLLDDAHARQAGGNRR